MSVEENVLELTRQATEMALDGMRRGYLEPHRAAESASLRERIRFQWARAVFRLRKYSVAFAVLLTGVFVVAVLFAATELHRAL